MPSAEAWPPGVGPFAASRYRVSGLALASEIELASLFPNAFPPEEADVELLLSRNELRPPAPENAGTNWAVTADQFWLEVPGVGQFLASGGRRLLVHPADMATVNSISLVVAGTATAALLHQRNLCAFHASAVEVGGSAVLFMAPSGNGKSTLAARLTRLGFPLLADDLCRLDTDSDGVIRVHPDGRRIKLWQDAVDRLQLPSDGPVLPSVDKFYVSADRRAVGALPVGAIYLMRRTDAALSEPISAAPPAHAVGALLSNAFRPRQIARLGVGPAYLQTARALALAGKVFELVNSFDPQQAGATPRRLIDHWETLGLTAAAPHP